MIVIGDFLAVAEHECTGRNDIGLPRAPGATPIPSLSILEGEGNFIERPDIDAIFRSAAGPSCAYMEEG